MKDLIDRQEAIVAVCESVCEGGLCRFLCPEINALKALPSAQPYTDEEIRRIQELEQAQFDKIRELAYQEGKADAMAEIIRCRECKLRDTEYCNMAHGFMGMKDDDYCSYAERREVSE